VNPLVIVLIMKKSNRKVESQLRTLTRLDNKTLPVSRLKVLSKPKAMSHLRTLKMPKLKLQPRSQNHKSLQSQSSTSTRASE
jgi:hypothetical protein